jgi:hypothetical protein
MDIQYIRDINGNIAFAVVPIDIWEDMASQTIGSYASKPSIKYASQNNETKKAFDPDEFLGCISIKMSNKQVFDELNQLRGEWDRDFL